VALAAVLEDPGVHVDERLHRAVAVPADGDRGPRRAQPGGHRRAVRFGGHMGLEGEEARAEAQQLIERRLAERRAVDDLEVEPADPHRGGW
jgi:hypothetical protein